MPMRKCHCSGHCGPPPSSAPNRREFIGMMGAATAALLVPGAAWAAFQLPDPELKRWQRTLLDSPPRRYFSSIHTDARLHLGGIGTGNFEIGADGQFTTWQLFNTLRDGQLPFHFAVKTNQGARLLQTAGGPERPRVKNIEMTGEYPAAVLRFEDEALPVQLGLTAFTPFAPLDAAFSAIPVACFHFRVHNPTAVHQEISLAAFMANPIGYDALGDLTASLAHPSVGWNITEPFHDGHATGILFKAKAGQDPILDNSVTLYAPERLRELKTPPHDCPKNLRLEILDPKNFSSASSDAASVAIIWIADSGLDLSRDFLQKAADAAKAGAAVIFSEKETPVLSAYRAVSADGNSPASLREDIVFEDFENGYGSWTVTGEAFGPAPASGTLPGQQAVTGFLGHGLVNSFFGGDDAKGKLTSRSFAIERGFIRFLIGGGSGENTQIRLLIDGRTTRAASGRDVEKLEPRVWDVHEFAGKTARIEIVDEATGGWGHINVDQIVFTDWPADRDILPLLGELLPPHEADWQKTPGGTAYQSRALGKGRVAVVSAPLLDPQWVQCSPARQRAYADLCAIAGARYTAPNGHFAKAPGFGTVCLATTASHATPLPRSDDLDTAWQQFSEQGAFHAQGHAAPNAPTPPGKTSFGSLAAKILLAPGASAEVPFFLAWHYPNKYNDQTGEWIGCHYATQWSDARGVVRDLLARGDALARTDAFRQTMRDTTLPGWLTDCLTANAAIIRHIGVVFRPSNGDIYGWEGSNGCCEPTCTHVWGYEQSLSRLFPGLERDMRRIDFKHQQGPDGGVNNRTVFPSPPHPTGEHPFADGHASCILKAYREALNSPDESFFRDYWPHIKRAVEYLIDRDAKSNGGQFLGVLQDDQWNTYDEALHGVTTFISGYYLAALRAGEEWARRMDDSAAADRFRAVFEAGQKKLVELCWNGEYFQQNLADYLTRGGEFGPGCMSDQLLGQWWAHQLDLGYILPRDMVVSAMRSVFKYNFKTDLTGWKHAPRAFAGAGDKGLIVCTWPKGGRPDRVLLYSDELWTGMEYQVAGHLVYEGLIQEGLSVAKAARDRYDGVPRAPIARNPWNEIECGGHYARAMSSWSLLLGLSGFYCDGPRQAVRFAPRLTPQNFKSFFTAPESWGSFSQNEENVIISVREGRLPIRVLELSPQSATLANATCSIGGRRLTASLSRKENTVVLTFGSPVTVVPGGDLKVEFS